MLVLQTGVTLPQAGSRGATRNWRRKYRVLPWRHGPTDSLISESGLLDHEWLSSYCFRMLRCVVICYSSHRTLIQWGPPGPTERTGTGPVGYSRVTGLLGSRRGTGHGDAL